MDLAEGINKAQGVGVITNKISEGYLNLEQLASLTVNVLRRAQVALSLENDVLVAVYERDKRLNITTPGRLRALIMIAGVDFDWKEGGDISRGDWLGGVEVTADVVDSVSLI